jgi:hypothetical protein
VAGQQRGGLLRADDPELAATLFISYGLNGWAVFAGIVLAGLIVMFLCDLVGRPSVRYGIPYAVMARASMGVHGTQFPTLIRGITAMFWYGAQTYFASTAVALLITALFGPGPEGTFLGLSAVGWTSYVIVALVQLALFSLGIRWIGVFLNWAGPAVYTVMIAMMIALWAMAGGDLFSELGTVFAGGGDHPPPGQPVGRGHHPSDRSGGPGRAHLRRDLAVGDDLARPQGANDLGDPLGEPRSPAADGSAHHRRRSAAG